jgi:hypothetical protein
MGKSTLALYKITGEMKVTRKGDLREIMAIRDQRRHPRLKKNFQVTLHKRVPGNQDLLLKGNTLDLSQGGAFIKTEGWRLLDSGELTELTVFLPPDFTGVDTPIRLQGDSIITRIDREKESIAVKFIKTFKEFDRIDLPDLH